MVAVLEHIGASLRGAGSAQIPAYYNNMSQVGPLVYFFAARSLLPLLSRPNTTPVLLGGVVHKLLTEFKAKVRVLRACLLQSEPSCSCIVSPAACVRVFAAVSLVAGR
jgi:hypothetical protein